MNADLHFWLTAAACSALAWHPVGKWQEHRRRRLGVPFGRRRYFVQVNGYERDPRDADTALDLALSIFQSEPLARECTLTVAVTGEQLRFARNATHWRVEQEGRADFSP